MSCHVLRNDVRPPNGGHPPPIPPDPQQRLDKPEHRPLNRLPDSHTLDDPPNHKPPSQPTRNRRHAPPPPATPRPDAHPPPPTNPEPLPEPASPCPGSQPRHKRCRVQHPPGCPPTQPPAPLPTPHQTPAAAAQTPPTGPAYPPAPYDRTPQNQTPNPHTHTSNANQTRTPRPPPRSDNPNQRCNTITVATTRGGTQRRPRDRKQIREQLIPEQPATLPEQHRKNRISPHPISHKPRTPKQINLSRQHTQTHSHTPTRELHSRNSTNPKKNTRLLVSCRVNSPRFVVGLWGLSRCVGRFCDGCSEGGVSLCGVER